MGLTQTPAAVSIASSPSLSKRLVGLIKVICWLVAGFLLAAVMDRLLPDIHFQRATINALVFYPAMVVVPLAVLYLSVAVHELGHIAGGALVGLRFLLMIVGPLQIRSSELGVRVGYSGRWSYLGGFSVCTPTDDHNLVRRVSLLTAGGLFASLALFTLVYVLSFALQNSRLNFWFGTVLLNLTFISVLILLLSGLPVRMGGFTNDGFRLLALLRGGPQVERMAALFILSGISASGQRPRDRPSVWYERALSFADESADDASANYFAYFRALDTGDLAQAAAFLDGALSLWQKVPPVLRSLYFLEAAYFEARHGHDPAAARAWLDLARGGMLVERHTRLRAEAAVLLAEGRFEEARAHADQGLATIGRTIDKGLAKAEADWLREIKALSEQRAGHAGTTADVEPQSVG